MLAPFNGTRETASAADIGNTTGLGRITRSQFRETCSRYAPVVTNWESNGSPIEWRANVHVGTR